MSDFEQKALTNPHVAAEVEAGRRALHRRFSDANIGNTLASEIVVTVVEAVRSSVFREAADMLQLMINQGSFDSIGDMVVAIDMLRDRADADDSRYRQRHQSPDEELIEALKIFHNVKIEIDHGDWSHEPDRGERRQ